MDRFTAGHFLKMLRCVMASLFTPRRSING
jgi:hypothetical protein